MKTLPKLTPRLHAVASLVRCGKRAADIGTDHGYLAVWLTKSGTCPSCIACDVNEGPLQRAQETVRVYGAQEMVSLRLSDGLDAVRPMEADDIVIAGMGGELIAKIIARCEWLRGGEKHLVLQPMTAQPELRKVLCENGFEILREVVAREGEKLYVVMSAVYSGRVFEPDALFMLTGKIPQNRDELSGAYLRKLAQTMQKQVDGMAKAKQMPEGMEETRQLARTVAELAESFGRNQIDNSR